MPSALLDRLLRASKGDWPPECARQLPAIAVTPDEQACCDVASDKVQVGTLTLKDRGGLEDW